MLFVVVITSPFQLDIPVQPIAPGFVEVVRRKGFAAFLELPVGRADRADQQRHAGLLRGAAAFLEVAGGAGGGDVVPAGSPTQPPRDDVIEGQVARIAAILAREPVAHQLAEAMKLQKLTKVAMAKRMNTSRSQLDRLLDPANGSVSLETLTRAAMAVGRQIRLELI